ncbi:hypothetical protein FRX31_021651 [Thalictrum thalictroides]|uniref:CHY-type domain-containing protein n=1 Tax=Thalictrum thalictroides TaxID=46969 RepID=A0A7J6VUI7_THATH|nr:hypothetical protein FRX31_021651 [Thalictrum thalictroides]
MEVSVSDSERQDIGKLEYGCEHYKRRCKIRGPCFNKVFTCRHCHNAAMCVNRRISIWGLGTKARPS